MTDKKTPREEIKELFFNKVGPGKISPEIAAPYLGVSFRTVYYWMDNADFTPSAELCGKVLNFLELVNKIKESWTVIVSAHNAQKKIHPAVQAAYFRQPFHRILSDKKKSDGKKVEMLTQKTLKLYAAEIAEQGEK